MQKTINRVVTISILLALFYGNAWAQKMYVTDVLKLRLWAGKGSGQPVVKVIQSGQSVEVLLREDNWAQVRTSDGKEGWVQNRFLVQNMTSKGKLARLQRKHKALMIQNSVLLDENGKLKDECKKHLTDLDEIQKNHQEISKSFESLKTDAAGYLELKTNYDKVNARVKDQTKKLMALEEELEKYETNHTIRWFLTGAGVLIIGLIIGFSTRPKRRRSLLS